MTNGVPPQETGSGRIDQWDYTPLGRARWLQREITLSGSTYQVDFTLPFPMRIDHIVQMFNDATARDFYVRVFYLPRDSVYNLVDKGAANTDISVTTPLGEWFLLPVGARIRFYYENFTAGKTVKIVIQGRFL